MERVGAWLRPGAPARPDVLARYARRRLAEAHRAALQFPRPDDHRAPRLVGEAPHSARPGTESLAGVLHEARRARPGARAARRATRLLDARRARAAGLAA